MNIVLLSGRVAGVNTINHPPHDGGGLDHLTITFNGGDVHHGEVRVEGRLGEVTSHWIAVSQLIEVRGHIEARGRVPTFTVLADQIWLVRGRAPDVVEYINATEVPV